MLVRKAVSWDLPSERLIEWPGCSPGVWLLTDPVGDADRGSPHTACAGNSLRAEVNDLSSHSDEHHVVLVGEIMMFFFAGGNESWFSAEEFESKEKEDLVRSL